MLRESAVGGGLRVKYVFDVLGDTSATTVLTWILAISAIFGSLTMGYLKLIKYLERYRELKNKEDEENRIIQGHTESIKEIRQDIKELVDFNAKMVEVNKIQTRNSIVRICNEALDKGYIDSIQLQALEDSYDMYSNILKGNSYVLSLVVAVRKLQVCFRGNPRDGVVE